MFTEVDSTNVFERYYLLWRIVGFTYKKPTAYIRAYSIFVTICVTIYYPIHLSIGLLLLREPKDIFRNLMTNVACLACSIKHFFYFPQFARMEDICRLLKELDSNILTKEDRDFHRKNVGLITELLLNLYAIAYQFVGLSAVLMCLMSDEQALIYLAWFPFDWKSSTWKYYVAFLYQLVGFQIEIFQNIANDTYVPIGLCLLSGHIRLLARRLARIGYDEGKSEKEHYADLVECAGDYERLMRFFFQLQEAISWNMLLQSFTVGLNFCFCVIFVVFYAEGIFEYGYAIGFLIAILIEFYPGCYYGSCVEENFHDLTYAMFSCEWQSRSPAFRRSLRILIEFSLRQKTMYAKNMVKINLDTYLATMRLSYSLFCLVLNMK